MSTKKRRNPVAFPPRNKLQLMQKEHPAWQHFGYVSEEWMKEYAEENKKKIEDIKKVALVAYTTLHT